MRSEVPIVERSLARVEDSDLRRLAELATEDREEFFTRNPRWRRLYANRRLCVALCQGAALHYIDCTNGVKDFDVWTFYAEHPEASFPHRRRGRRDFGLSHFGRHPADREFAGRAVDFLARSLWYPVGADPIAAVQTYLSEGHSESARRLAQKAVVVLEPAQLRGHVIWSMAADVPAR
jgi:hypothetical protein